MFSLLHFSSYLITYLLHNYHKKKIHLYKIKIVIFIALSSFLECFQWAWDWRDFEGEIDFSLKGPAILSFRINFTHGS